MQMTRNADEPLGRRNRVNRFLFPVLLFSLVNGSVAGYGDVIELRKINAVAPDGFVEIRGVAAEAFDAGQWKDRAPFSLPDHRSPLLASREGKFRNIYAPSVVQTDAGWRIFYGAWDGVASGNDRIYSADTHDFLTFDARRTVIEHGDFHHVCNVSALRLADGAYSMACTALAKDGGLNKPAYFSSPDGETWNRSPSPHHATRADLMSMTGYAGFDAADINGMNVLLHDAGRFLLYFCNFKDFGTVYRAGSVDGKHYEFEGAVLNRAVVVNDVKKLIDSHGSPSYLMALHMNKDQLWYSVSSDSMKFPPSRVLADHQNDTDRYMVAVGWVVDGPQETPGRRVLGFLYGAGAKPSLDANRIFARWFQRKAVVACDDGHKIEPVAALGPDRQLLPVNRDVTVTGQIQLFGENRDRAQSTSEPVRLQSGDCYEIVR